MKPDDEYDERLCRLNGKQPTIREKWTAFHRLWRISQGHGATQDMAVAYCFRTFFHDWGWVQLLESSEKEPSRVQWPVAIRRLLLERDKRKRLFGEYYERLDECKRVARTVHDQGIEVTPEEVAQVREKVIRCVRGRAAEMNVRVPTDDNDLLRWLKQIYP